MNWKNKSITARTIMALGVAAVLLVAILSLSQITSAQILSTTTTTGKFLRAIMLSYVNQQTLRNIYRYPVVDRGDVVDMHTNINNLQSAKQLAASTGATFGGSFFSLSAISQYAPFIKSNGGTQVGYDLESGSSPTSELANPVGSMITAANIAHKYGLKLMVDSSKSLTRTYGAQFAKIGNIYNIQAQALEGTPSSYISFVKSETNIIKLAHPGIPVIAETSTSRGTVSQMEQCFAGVASVVDGSTTWFGGSTTTQLQQYLQWFVAHYG